MELVVAPKEGNWTRFWSVREISYDQGYVVISGHIYRDDEPNNNLEVLVKKPEEIERIWVILDNEKMKDTIRKQLTDVYWSSKTDYEVLGIKVETHKTTVETRDLVDWVKVN